MGQIRYGKSIHKTKSKSLKINNPKGQVPDYDAPVILQKKNCSVEAFCFKIHRNIIKELKYATVWGSSVKHQGMKVGRDHILHDEDVIQLVKKN